MVNEGPHQTTNTTKMAEPFANIVARLWGISSPHPREPLWEGLIEGSVAGFYLGKTTQITSVSVFCNPRTVDLTCTFQEQLIVVED